MTLIIQKIAVAMNVNSFVLSSVVLWISIFCLLTKLVTQECLGQVYIQPQLRCENYDSYNNVGSCAHANTITLLRYHSFHKLANWIPTQFSGPGIHYKINKRLNKWNISTYSTFSSSKAILDFAHVNSIPAIISYHTDHSCIFLGWYIDPKTRIITHAYVLNPNYTSSIETPTYTTFMNNWRENDGEAVVIVP